MPRAVWNDTILAERDDVMVMDGYAYFPRDAVRWEHREPSAHTSACRSKGQATDHSIVVDETHNPDAAWDPPRADRGREAERGAFAPSGA